MCLAALKRECEVMGWAGRVPWLGETGTEKGGREGKKKRWQRGMETKKEKQKERRER